MLNQGQQDALVKLSVLPVSFTLQAASVVRLHSASRLGLVKGTVLACYVCNLLMLSAGLCLLKPR